MEDSLSKAKGKKEKEKLKNQSKKKSCYKRKKCKELRSLINNIINYQKHLKQTPCMLYTTSLFGEESMKTIEQRGALHYSEFEPREVIVGIFS